MDLRYDIINDLSRFFKLHLWYKHLSFEGTEFLVFPWKGQQPKNCFDLQIKDEHRLHWWVWYADFIDEIPIDGRGKEIVMQHSVRLNCFLRGFETDCSVKDHSYFRGWFLITRKYPEANKILEERYPEARGNTDIFVENEYKRQFEEVEYTARQIYKIMENDCPQWLGLSPYWRDEMCISSLSFPKDNSPSKEDEKQRETVNPSSLSQPRNVLSLHSLPSEHVPDSHVHLIERSLSSDLQTPKKRKSKYRMPLRRISSTSPRKGTQFSMKRLNISRDTTSSPSPKGYYSSSSNRSSSPKDCSPITSSNSSPISTLIPTFITGRRHSREKYPEKKRTWLPSFL